MHHHPRRVAYITFRVVQPYAHLGLETGDTLYVRFGAKRFTVLAPDHTCRFIPPNYGSVLGAMTGGHLEQIAGLYMDQSAPVRQWPALL